jgi:hypothetical protein
MRGLGVRSRIPRVVLDGFDPRREREMQDQTPHAPRVGCKARHPA